MLSAILLDDAYYNFMLAGRREGGGLTWIGEDRLIPLKAHAWLDLTARKERGEPVDSRSIRKHGNDVIRLSQLLSPDIRIPVPSRVAGDLDHFLQRLMSDSTYNPASLGLGNGAATCASCSSLPSDNVAWPFTPVKSGGEMGDGRRYETAIAQRMAQTVDLMTAHCAHLPYELLDVASRHVGRKISSY